MEVLFYFCVNPTLFSCKSTSFSGQASSDKAKLMGQMVMFCANIGCKFIDREEQKMNETNTESGNKYTFLISYFLKV